MSGSSLGIIKVKSGCYRERCERVTITGTPRKDSRDAEGYTVYKRNVW